MKLNVDAYRCKLCGACQEIDPETFEVDENACEIRVHEHEDMKHDLLEQASAWCPAHCIEIEEDENTEQKN